MLAPQLTVNALGHKWNDGEVVIKPTDDTEGLKKFTCTVCSAVKEEKLPPLNHEHMWDSGEITTQPTCTESGIKTYKCACGQTRTEPVAAAGRNLSEEWQSSESNHWHDCLNNCGEISGAAAHTWNDGTVTKQPAAGTVGEKTFECTVCGKTRTESIPATGNSDKPLKPNTPNKTDTPGKSDNPISADKPDDTGDTDDGNISKEVQPGENVPATKLETPLDELIYAVLAPEEQKEVDNGVDIKIVLTVEDGTKSAPEEDKIAVEKVIGELTDFKLGQYLDVNLLKILGSTQTKITETGAPITVIFEIPDALRGEGRSYSVIRVHNGETTVLYDQDNDADTVTIRTDKFSTYALAYSEKANSTSSSGSRDPTTPDENGSDNNDPTPSKSGPAESDNTSPSAENPSTDESGTDTGNGTPSSDENNSVPIENAPSENGETPSTGIAVSFISLAAAVTVLTAAAKRKKK